MNKVLFLDVDGVLNSTKSLVAFGNYPMPKVDAREKELFDLTSVELIKKVCKDTNTKIVLSSSWRNCEDWEFVLKGLLGLDIIDITPTIYDGDRGWFRGNEIKAWLTEHPEVTKYAIVDDNNDFLEEQEEFFVQTNATNGLSYNDYLLLKDILEDKDVKN